MNNPQSILDADALTRMCFFSAPQWSWKKTSGKVEIDELHNKVEIALTHAKGHDVSEAFVTIPSDFIRFYRDILSRGSCDWADVHFKLIQDGKQYLFMCTYTDNEDGENYDICLWHWVPSNLPKWAKQGKHVARFRGD